MGAHMTRTEVCELLGVSAKSLYLWEKGGLIPAPRRDARNWRTYSQDDVAAIRRFLGADSDAKTKAGTRTETARREDRLSARNQLSGMVVEMRKSGLMCEVVLRLGDGQEIAAIITVASADRLGLRKGRQAMAIIKATEVMMMR
jgi:molybdopterin-binding protein